MAKQGIQVPKGIFRAQELMLKAQRLDYGNKPKAAMKQYLEAAKLFAALLKKFPQTAHYQLWAEEARTCIMRIKQLKNGVSQTNSPQSHHQLQQQELEQQIEQTRIIPNSNLTWDDIIGLDAVVNVLREVIFLPLKHPELLRGNIKTPRTILLFGPPGCGKTHLIRVLAAQVNIPIYSVSAATLLSKWHGESQKKIHALYHNAWKHAPSIIFIDEFDGLFGSVSQYRDSTETSATAVQMQKELQQFMDGMYSPKINQTVTIAATNFPWRIQYSQIRRFDRLLYIPPPDSGTILKMVDHFLTGIPHTLSVQQMYHLALWLKSRTPDEIRKICEEARLRSYQPKPSSIKTTPQGMIPQPVHYEDLLSALKILKPLLEKRWIEGVGTLKFREWNEDHGIPPIYYSIQPWENFGYSPKDDPELVEAGLAEEIWEYRRRR